ncbi:MAG: hypothetical protein ACLTSG_07210 [Lachnospiraceae bacterium]
MTAPSHPPSSTATRDLTRSTLGGGYLRAIPHYMGEVASALAPIVAFFLLFQIISLRLRKLPFLRIVIGLVYTYVGLAALPLLA